MTLSWTSWCNVQTLVATAEPLVTHLSNWLQRHVLFYTPHMTVWRAQVPNPDRHIQRTWDKCIIHWGHGESSNSETQNKHIPHHQLYQRITCSLFGGSINWSSNEAPIIETEHKGVSVCVYRSGCEVGTSSGSAAAANKLWPSMCTGCLYCVVLRVMENTGVAT